MIFIDTGAFIARFLIRDQHHEKSLAKWEKLQKSKKKCFTSNFVLDETFTLLGRWVNYDFAADKANNIYTSNAFTILRPELEDELAALKYFKKYADQKVSFTDCISFVLANKNKIKNIFTFDQHFKRAGYKQY